MAEVERQPLEDEQQNAPRPRDHEVMGPVLLVFLVELFCFVGYTGGFFFDLVTGEDQYEIASSIYLFVVCSVGLVLLTKGLFDANGGFSLTLCIWIRHIQTCVVFTIFFMDMCIRFDSYRKDIKVDFPKSNPTAVAVFYMVGYLFGGVFHVFCAKALHNFTKYQQEKNPEF